MSLKPDFFTRKAQLLRLAQLDEMTPAQLGDQLGYLDTGAYPIAVEAAHWIRVTYGDDWVAEHLGPDGFGLYQQALKRWTRYAPSESDE